MEDLNSETIYKPAKAFPKDPSDSAAFIFLHGFGDDGHGLCNIADQFQNAQKLPHLSWVFPTAPENKEAMQRA